ncbi:MAG: sigma-70 family RNA polymerase sigma factor [Cyclobacteriaceae bacterium]|jgi:RNA polymerase sigma factor (sigma-70 family)
MTDQKVIELLKSGNQQEKNQAVIYIQQKFFPMYRSIIRKRGAHDPEKALLHESLVVLYQKVRQQKFILTGRLTSFLYSVCDRITLTYLRENGKEVKKENMEEITEEVLRKHYQFDNLPEINSLISIDDQSFLSYESIRQEIQRLGSPCQDILFAYYFHQVRIKEIADELGYASENSAKQAKFKCLERLKKQMNALIQ